MSSQALEEKAAALYQGEALAPMVRASTTPMRALALKYGADFVYTEELVDRSLSDTMRVENKDLGTIDYVRDPTKLAKKIQRRIAKQGTGPPLILRVDRKVEAKKLVCQMGTGEPELALAAALHVKQDVDAFDINMGCPKKFSVSGGMGSALLKDPDRASRVLRALRDHLPEHPVSCKIRLLEDTQSTVDFITAMVERGGAHAVAIHARQVGDDCVTPANWKELEQVVPLVRAKYPTLPLLINGDFYTRKEFTEFHQKYGTHGVLLARPALYNMSIFRKPTPADAATTSYGDDSPLLLDKTQVVQDYLREAVQYDYNHKNIKYVIGEMMTNRRTPTWRVPNMPQRYPGQQTIGKTMNCNSLEAICKLWDVRFSLGDNNKTQQLPAGEHKYDDSYMLRGESTPAANKSSSTEEKTTKQACCDEKKEEEPPTKRTKTECDSGKS